MAVNQNRRLRVEDLDADKKTLIGIQTLPGYAPHDAACTSEKLISLEQQMHAAQQEEIRATQALDRARVAAIASEWAMHNALLKAKHEVRAQFGDESDALTTVGLKRKSERKRPVRRAA
ncbi:MAG: hypothetical protein IPO81_14395 [Kouleothrix sp.]|nr:hypothetical protein [Kouleothrix sp.]